MTSIVVGNGIHSPTDNAGHVVPGGLVVVAIENELVRQAIAHTLWKRGWVGGLAIGVAIVGWDGPALRLGGQTISDWWASVPLHRRLLVWTLITLHLHRELAPKWLHRFDPIGALARVVRAL